MDPGMVIDHLDAFALQEARISFAELRLAPATLAEMISLIEGGAISGKIGKQILPDLLEVCGVSCSRHCSVCRRALRCPPPAAGRRPAAAGCIPGMPELQMRQAGYRHVLTWTSAFRLLSHRARAVVRAG